MLAVSKLKLGDQMQGKVVEIFPDGELLMSFGGSLLRVQNEAHRPFTLGQVVRVVVKAVDPVRFQILEGRREQRRRGHLDVSV